MYYSKNGELKITLLLVNIIVNTERQHSQNYAAGLKSLQGKTDRYSLVIAAEC